MNLCPHTTTEKKQLNKALKFTTTPLCKFVNYIIDGYEYS